jgi:hypothetical protein
MGLRRVASARPPVGGAARWFGHGLQIRLRARELWRALVDGFKQHALLTQARRREPARRHSAPAVSSMPAESGRGNSSGSRR